MGQQANPRREADGEAKVFVRAIRVSPRKLGLVAGHIRGMKASHALAQLQFLNKRVAQDVRKALQSAVANAENNHSLDVDSLVVSQAWVGKGIVMKRFSARARGRSSRIIKPFSNLTIIVREAKE